MSDLKQYANEIADDFQAKIEKQLSELQKSIAEGSKQIKEASDKQLSNQQNTEKSEGESQIADAAQSAKDQVNQQLAKIPQKIEDDLDEFNKTLKSLMGKNISPKVDVNSPKFDLDATLGDFKKVLNPLIGAVSPIEAVVGKVPVIGDIMGAVTKLTSNNDNGGLTKEDINKLVPNKPEAPQTLLNKIDETCINIQEFCTKLPILLIDVIFQMLASIYDMFDQIVGIIGVPPAIFPFSLIKAIPTLMPKITDFCMNAPSQIKDIVMGVVKEKYAASMALATPKLPSPSAAASSAANAAKESTNTAMGKPSPKSAQESPIQSPVVPTPVVQSVPPEQVAELTWSQVSEKWENRLHDEYNFKKSDISKMIECYKVMYNGTNERINYYHIGGTIRKTKRAGSIIRKTITPNEVDKQILSKYNNILKNDPYLGYDRTYKASTLLNNASTFAIADTDTSLKSELKQLGDKIVAAGIIMIFPEKKWFGIF